MEVPLNGGMGYVVLFGGLEITGVFLLAVSVALQPAKKITLQSTVLPQRRKGAKENQRKTFAPLRLCGKYSSALVIEIIFNYRTPIVFLWQWFTGNAILTLDPTTEIDKLAPL